MAPIDQKPRWPGTAGPGTAGLAAEWMMCGPAAGSPGPALPAAPRLRPHSAGLTMQVTWQ